MLISGKQRQIALALWEELKLIDREIQLESEVKGSIERQEWAWDFSTGKVAVELVDELRKLHGPLEKLPLPEGDEPWLRLLGASKTFVEEKTKESRVRFSIELQTFQNWLFRTYDLEGEFSDVGRRMQVNEETGTIVLDGTTYPCPHKKAVKMLAILLQREKAKDKPIAAKDLGGRAWGTSVSDGLVRKELKKLPHTIYECLDKRPGGGHGLTLPPVKK